MGAIKFLGPFAFAISIPLLYNFSAGAPFIVPVAILFSLVIAEQLRLPSPDCEPSPHFRLLPILYIPLQLFVTLWAAHVSITSGTVGFASLAVSTGVCTGVFGVLAAHEMVHSRNSWHRVLGALMLTGMTYRHFRIAHIYGHHRYAATARDASTARLGETFYAFLPRTFWQQIIEAYRFEQRRCNGRKFPLLCNRLIQDAILMSAIYATLGLFWGPIAAALLAAASAIGIVILELFNYVAHYGLVRQASEERLEPFQDRHSWNSTGLGNLLIFNMGRHGQHHRAPSVSYEELRPAPAPELPAGYSGSIALALVPPLWRALMDPRAEAFNWAGAEAECPAAPEANAAIL